MLISINTPASAEAYQYTFSLPTTSNINLANPNACYYAVGVNVYNTSAAAAQAAGEVCVNNTGLRFETGVTGKLTFNSASLFRSYYEGFIEVWDLDTTKTLYYTDGEETSYPFSVQVDIYKVKVIENKYTIKISTITAQSYGSYLTAIEPGDIVRSDVDQINNNKVKLIAEVKDQDGKLVNTAIKLKVTAIEESGGHIQAYHTDRSPLQAGKLKVGTLNSHTINLTKGTMINGVVEFEFTASAISGDHKIEATCTGITCEQIGQDSVWVGVKNLLTLPVNDYYRFIGDTKAHPDNHYISKLAETKIDNIAFIYDKDFPDDPVLHINDISLERGGLFDIKGKWKTPHKTHDKGTDIDIRANEELGNTSGAIPKSNYEEFESTSLENGCIARIHSKTTSNEHYHLNCR